MKPRSDHSGLPSRQQVLDFIAGSPTPAGKREIAREFGLKGQEKIALKAMLRDMADEGLIDGEKRAFHRMGGVPRVTVLRVVAIEDGEAIAIPDNWSPDPFESVGLRRRRACEWSKRAATARSSRATGCWRAPKRRERAGARIR